MQRVTASIDEMMTSIDMSHYNKAINHSPQQLSQGVGFCWNTGEM